MTQSTLPFFFSGAIAALSSFKFAIYALNTSNAILDGYITVLATGLGYLIGVYTILQYRSRVVLTQNKVPLIAVLTTLLFSGLLLGLVILAYEQYSAAHHNQFGRNMLRVLLEHNLWKIFNLIAVILFLIRVLVGSFKPWSRIKAFFVSLAVLYLSHFLMLLFQGGIGH